MLVDCCCRVLLFRSLSDGGWSLFVTCCLLFVVCYFLFVVLVIVVRLLLSVVHCFVSTVAY